MKLNVGGQQTIGRFPEGWTCVDILDGADIQQDIAKVALPFEKGSVDAIYCSHVLEHIWKWDLPFVLNEFNRVLKSGGKLRVVVPDMDIALHRFMENKNDPDALDECMKWWFDPSLNGEGKLFLNHVGGFNYMSLVDKLNSAKFTDIRRKVYGSHDPIFEGCDNPGHVSTSLYMESIK